MDRYRTGAFTIVLGLALLGSVASVHARAQEYAGQEIGTIRYINRVQNLIILDNGDEFRTTDQRVLQPLREGEMVKVDFSFNGDHAVINYVEPAQPDEALGATPGTEGGVQGH
jgi:hypothetical protein